MRHPTLHQNARARRNDFRDAGAVSYLAAVLAKEAGGHTEAAALAAEAIALLATQDPANAKLLGRRGVIRHLVGLTSAGRHFKGEPSAVKATEAAAEALWALCTAHTANIGVAIQASVRL